MEITYEIAMAAGQDAGNRHMKQHGRTVWNEDDWNAAASEFNRLFPDSTIGFLSCGLKNGLLRATRIDVLTVRHR